MISKILFTLAVIMVCMWLLSNRRGAGVQLREVINPEKIKRNKRLLQASFVFMAIMVVAAAVIVYQDSNSLPVTVTVHVINTQSGEKTSYRAIREEIQGDSFTTLDGRRIYVAGVVRLEVETN